MKRTLLTKSIFFIVLALLGSNEIVSAQVEQPEPKKVNFGYSKNPKTKAKAENTEDTTNTENTSINSSAENTSTNIQSDDTSTISPISLKITENTTTPVEADKNEIKPVEVEKTEIKLIEAENQPVENLEFESRSVANKTLEVAKRASNIAISPTEIYKIGVGDVLFVSLQNAPAKVSTYFTVLNDGTIDYPLAGEMVSVGGLTTEEVEDLLKQKIKLYENPQVSVKVREHASHSITVLGMVEKAGEKYLQREAMPLFIVRAEAVVQPKANTVVIKRANSIVETINLRDPKSEDILIFPGDIVEFKTNEISIDNSSAPQFYYIGGNIISGGQKNFHPGLTLTQAILASGGLKKQTVRKVVIRRVNQTGLLSPVEFDLNSIKGGKQPDPILHAGDTIEVAN